MHPFLVMLLVLLHAAAPARSQQVTGCVECDLRVAPIARLGGVDAGQGFVGEPVSMALLPDGRFVLADRYQQARLKIYGPEGRFLRGLGRRGAGPGEYRVINAVWALPDGGLEVYDFTLMRITRLDADFEVVDTRRYDGRAATIARLPDGSHVGGQPGPTPLHWVDTAGVQRTSFGADPSVEGRRSVDLYLRQVTPASDSSVWAGHYVKYSLEEWALSGRRLRSLHRSVDWFPATTEGGFVDAESPPNPALRALHRDVDGLLWAVTWVADPDWREGLTLREDLYGRERLWPGNPSDYYDSVVEVIDPERRTVVGWARLDLAIMGFAEDGVAFGYDEEDEFEPVVVVVRLELPGR